MRFKFYALMLVVVMLFAACGGTDSSESIMEDDTTMMDQESSDEIMDEESHDDEMMEEDAMMDDQSGEDMMADDDYDDAMMDDENSDEEMMDDESDDDMMSDDNQDVDAMMDSDDSDQEMMADSASDDMMPMADLPDWFSVQLTDVNTGESFSVADFQGKVVLVETLAVWCSNCLRQQNEVQALHELLGERDDFVSLGLDIDPNESADILSGHTARYNFDWVYAVATREVAREIGQLYGDQFLSPPSTPMFIIDRYGETHLLPFGIKSAEDLNAALESFLNDGM